MNLRILFLLAGAVTCALAFNSDRLETAVITSQLGAVPFKYGCKYRVSTVWNDIFFLVDRSGSYGEFLQLYYTLTKIVSPFYLSKIGSSKEYSVRTGIAFFNSITTVVGQFGQTLMSNISTINTLNYCDEDDHEANVDSALKTAETQLGESDRPLSKKVIVLLTTQTSYNSTYAADLKNKGFIINVYNLQNVAASSDLSEIQSLASSGYATDSINNSVEDLQRLQATVNCFCDPALLSFSNDNKTGAPTGGCYGVPKNTATTYDSAKNVCSQNFRGGIVTLDKDQEKADFLNGVNNSTESFYIGLKWTDEFFEPVWLWEDGSVLDGDDFNLFTSGMLPRGSSNLQCVIQTPNKNEWQAVSCRNSQRFVCETAPCDSTNYYCTPNI